MRDRRDVARDLRAGEASARVPPAWLERQPPNPAIQSCCCRRQLSSVIMKTSPVPGQGRADLEVEYESGDRPERSLTFPAINGGGDVRPFHQDQRERKPHRDTHGRMTEQPQPRGVQP
jgi:hypothetical protein